MTSRLTLASRAQRPDLNRLAQMRPAELQRLYQELFGVPVASGNSELARRKIAWHIQSEREGGVPESARQRALAIAKQAGLRIQVRHHSTGVLPHTTVTGIVSDHDSRIPMPGSVLVKEHRGKTVLVHVLDAGFEYDGQRLASLSAIAKKITGTKWNGYAFFGLAKEQRGR